MLFRFLKNDANFFASGRCKILKNWSPKKKIGPAGLRGADPPCTPLLSISSYYVTDRARTEVRDVSKNRKVPATCKIFSKNCRPFFSKCVFEQEGRHFGKNQCRKRILEVLNHRVSLFAPYGFFICVQWWHHFGGLVIFEFSRKMTTFWDIFSFLCTEISFFDFSVLQKWRGLFACFWSTWP